MCFLFTIKLWPSCLHLRKKIVNIFNTHHDHDHDAQGSIKSILGLARDEELPASVLAPQGVGPDIPGPVDVDLNVHVHLILEEGALLNSQ